jgi:EAL domain-containing protein (putative c-di-GMP-specific phosphodiesterase class I)
MVPPDQFIGLAEETGLIVPIGKYVLFTACTQAKAWYDQGHTDIKIAINLSARQLQDPRLPELVRDVLVTTGLPPTALHLEITESAAMKDYELTIQTLTEIRKMGVQFSIDDFGTSYSSLDYLKRFPVSSIKIDRSFIRDIMEDPDDAAITAAIIAMGHVLNLNLIAEGVDTAEQLSFLNSQACDECQGYLFYKPMPASQIPDLLADKHNLIEAHLENSNQKPVIKPPLYPIRKS